MLLENALTGAEAEAGESLRGVHGNKGLTFCRVFGWAFRWAETESGGDVDECETVVAFGFDFQRSPPLLIERVQSVIDDLHANLEQLVGIPADQQQLLRELGAHVDVEGLPLRLRKPNGGAQQSVQIDRAHGGRILLGKTEQTGYKRLGATCILADSDRQFILFRREWFAKQQQVGISEHGGDGIVQFVRGSAYQLSDRGEFFRLHDLCLQAFQVGEGVARVGEQAK